jgi:magnesium-transporting ATPase (P-type)
MISGDHIETAKRVAYKAGILTDEDIVRQNCVMDADDFRNQVGRLDQKLNDGDDGFGGTRLCLENEDNFRDTILEDCKVIARANSDDKFLMVVGLKNCHRTVAVTGDGINDVEALNNADVGLAMGSGCSAAKAASSFILVDDDF